MPMSDLLLEVKVAFDSEKDMNDAYDIIKASLAKANAPKATETMLRTHKCYHDEKQPKPCEVLKDDMETVKTLNKEEMFL